MKSKGRESSESSSSSYRSSKTYSETEGNNSRLSSLVSILRNRTFIFYTLIPAIVLSIITIISTDLHAWVLSEIHHFYIELFAVILGSILAFYYIARAYTLNDNFSRFVGFGFLVAALIDLLHVVISYTYMDNVMFLKYFIPQTWFAGRIFLSAMLVIAIAKYPTFSGEEKRRNEGILESETKTGLTIEGENKEGPRIEVEKKSIHDSRKVVTLHDKANESDNTFRVYLTILSILAGSIAISSLYLVLPFSVIDEVLLHRPYEIPSLILFIIALILFYKNQLYKKTDIFYKGILAYLIIDIYAQIIMSYSAVSFDTPHNIAHILKDAGYFVNIIALALSSIQYNVRLRESNESLIESNVRLKEREEVIRIQYDRLKESEKIKDEFINTAAHELRTPIQPILGLVDIVKSRIVTLDNSGSSRVVRDGDNATKRAEGVLLLLDVIIRNAKRLKQLTDNILDVTKIESHSFKLNKEQFNIEQLIEEIAEEQNIAISDIIITSTEVKIRLSASNKEIDGIADIGTATTVVPAVNVKSSAITTSKRGENKMVANKNADKKVNGDVNPVLESLMVEADKTKISQVLSNLLSNALSSIRLKAGAEDGRITISVKREEKRNGENKLEMVTKTHDLGISSDSNHEIIINVTDNGQGIPADVAQNLFTKFVSGSDSGTGLGLYISKNIIEAHGGRIWARNNDTSASADGTGQITSSGATFSFSLPALEIIT